MSSVSSQDLVLAASNRMEIIKTYKQLDYLKTVPVDILEKKLKEVSAVAKNASDISKSKQNTQLEVEEKREIVRKLLLRARKRKSAVSPNNEKLQTCQRLVEKINLMRRLTLAVMAGAQFMSPEFSLAISRDLIEEKTLRDYRRDSGSLREEES